MNRRSFIQNSTMAGFAAFLFPLRKPKTHKIKVPNRTIPALHTLEGLCIFGGGNEQVIRFKFDKPITLITGDTIVIKYKATAI